jgi:predicted RecB family nuclease
MSDVPPQGAYLAKSCPQAVQLGVLQPCEPLPRSPFMAMLGLEGIDFEARVFGLLAAAVPDAVVIDSDLSRSEREALTLGAMGRGARLVIGGRLPVDDAAHRAGEPDLLVRSDAFDPSTTDLGYLPVDVKHHGTLEAKKGVDGALTSNLEALFLGPSDPDAELEPKWRWPDLIQLAHYQRMLEACGHESRLGRWAGGVGREELIVWHDLDVPRWGLTEYINDPPPQSLSTMEAYDLEFAHRLAVIDAALVHASDPAAPLLAEPIAVPECGECGWRDWCFEYMERSGDLSLLPGMSIGKWRKCHARGVTTMLELASLDSTTARLIRARIDLRHLQEKTRSSDPSTPVADLLSGRPKQVKKLEVEGIISVADVARIDQRTASFSDSRLADLPAHIDNARAWLGPHPAYRRRGVHRVVVPRADIEIDVDMENVSEGCYLWGTLLNVHDATGTATSTFRPFVSWDPDTAVGEIEAFFGFWEWLSELQSQAARSGRSLRAYCYSQGAENGQLRRIAALCGMEHEVEDLLRSDKWVDLLPIVQRQLITGHGMGLKMVAPLAGFAWRGPEVGGHLAMIRYVEATSGEDDALRAKARQWILDYNEDDVRATAALRDWLDRSASSLPSIDEAVPDGPAPHPVASP